MTSTERQRDLDQQIAIIDGEIETALSEDAGNKVVDYLLCHYNELVVEAGYPCDSQVEDLVDYHNSPIKPFIMERFMRVD